MITTQTVVEILLRGGILTILVVSLDVLYGLAGRLSLAQGALFGVGAYAFALLVTDHGFSFVPALLVGVVAVGAIGALISLIAARTSHFYLAIATLAVQQLLVEMMRNSGWTGGSSGVFDIPRISIGGELTDRQMAAFVCAVALLVLLFDWWFSRASVGLRLRGIRDDDELMEAYGYSVPGLVMMAFTLSGALCAVAGVLYASSYGFIEPSGFSVDMSFDILIAFIIGGRGPLGAFLGAFFFATVDKLLTLPNLPSDLAGTIPQVVYGVVLVLAIAFMPGGAAGLLRGTARALRRGARSFRVSRTPA